MMNASVSLVVLNWNGRAQLERCLPSLEALDYPNYEIILVDNGSSDDSVAFVRERFPAIRIIENGENLGYPKGINVGLRAAEGEIIVPLNNDIVARPDFLRKLAAAMEADGQVGIAGCKIYFPDGRTLQHAGSTISYPLALTNHIGYGEVDRGQYDELREVDYVTGAAFAVKKEVLERIGYLEERFFLYFDDPDICLRAKKAGYKVIYVPDAVVIHYESSTNVVFSYFYYRHYHRSRMLFILKHYTAEQFVKDFFPAERERLRTVVQSSDELRALQRAYLEAMFFSLEGNGEGQEALLLTREPERQAEVLDALQGLREEAIARQAALKGAAPSDSLPRRFVLSLWRWGQKAAWRLFGVFPPLPGDYETYLQDGARELTLLARHTAQVSYRLEALEEMLRAQMAPGKERNKG